LQTTDFGFIKAVRKGVENVKKEAVVIAEAGVFLFRSPTKVSVRVNHDLFIVFTAPFARACGLALVEVDTSPKDMETMVDVLLTTMVKDLNVRPQEVRAKLFGMSNYRKQLMLAFEDWCERNLIIIGSRDLGRGVTRQIIVHCDNGLVGVRYAEPWVDDAPAFLAPGSAKQRSTNLPVEHRVLILSTNKVRRLLAKQAVEEYPGFEGTAPGDPHQFLVARHGKNLKYAHVLFFDDLENSPALKSFIHKMKHAISAHEVSWVGSNLPTYAKAFHLLPPLEPETIAQFKRHLNQALSEAGAPGDLPSSVIPFEKKKKIG
jgi:hypothetical protein